MRKSYDGLSGLARESHDIINGDVFLFLSRDKKKAKAIFWDGSGMNIWMKRLEQGQFAKIWERRQISISELQLFFEGSKSVLNRLSPPDLTKKFRA